MKIINGLLGLILLLFVGMVHAVSLVAYDDSFGVSFGQTLQVEKFGVLENDILNEESAGENGATAKLVVGVDNGTLTCPANTALKLCADGSFEYIPGVNFNGSDSFTYQAVYDTTLSTPVTVTLTACTGGPQIFSCWKESSYLAMLTELGYNAYLEGFEGTAWDTVRTPPVGDTNSAQSIISQGINWTSNYPLSNKITTGEGPAFTGLWGVYDPNHGSATGTETECNVDTPPEHCLYHDGVSGSILSGGTVLNGVGGYISGFTGANIAIIVNGINQINIGRLPGPGHQFFALIDTRTAGFSNFEFRDLDGKIGQKLYIFADDFIFATTDIITANNPPVLAPIGNRIVKEGKLLSFVLTASDLDADSLSFSMAGAPTGSSLIDNGDGTALFSWRPDFIQAGNYPVSFTVMDDAQLAATNSEVIFISVEQASKTCISSVLYLLL